MLLFLFLGLSLAGAAQTYDLVVAGGRVMDPESKLDAVRHLGIRGGKIAAISATPLTGTRTIDAKGLVVAPGFIDLHAHGQDAENQRYQVRDGVTTALELEIGAYDIDAWYKEREGKRLIHSGVSMGHVPSRMSVMRDAALTTSLVPSGDGARRGSSDEEITVMKRSVERGLQQGALGVGFGIQYTPAASRWEILEMFRVAGRFHAPVFVHIRHMGDAEPDALNALEEVISAATVTGAPLHVVHITSSGLAQTPKLLQTIQEAQARGMDITTECYPYNAAMTSMNSAMFDPGWQKILGISYDRLEWAATGERLTEETFRKYRPQPGMVIMHMIPDKIVEQAVAHPMTMIASDGMITNGKGHPRGAGTYARMLGYWSRERNSLSLMEAIRKMALMPAQRLERLAPQMKNKGRIRVGADADLAVFDAAKVIDRATFQQPALPSEGIPYVVVGGVPVVDKGTLREGVFPGAAVRAPIRP
ncbi:MAG TPA: amidohydrolase family protein [Bryobacteraceae bacterium]|nr:amidohydrolase family protein [Bryobacteraceae bacterium]